MTTIASQITSLTIVYSIVYSDADQRKHQSSASLAFVWGIHRWPVNSPHKGPVTRKMFPFDDVIMFQAFFHLFMPHWVSVHRLQGSHIGWATGGSQLCHWTIIFTNSYHLCCGNPWRTILIVFFREITRELQTTPTPTHRPSTPRKQNKNKTKQIFIVVISQYIFIHWFIPP